MTSDNSALSRVNNLTNNNAILQSSIADHSKRVSSGYKITKGMPELAKVNQASLLVEVEAEQSTNLDYASSSKNFIEEAEFINLKLQALSDLAMDLNANLTSMRSSSGKSMQFVTYANNLLKQIATNLNSTYNGSYVFGGNNTNKEPVDSIQFLKSNIINGSESNIYYQGGNNTKRFLINEDIVINDSITAAHPAIQKLVAAVHEGINANSFINSNTIDDSSAIKAQNFLQDAFESLTQLIAENGNNIKLAENNVDDLDNVNNFLQKFVDNIKNTDVPLEMAKFNETMSTLQAMYMLTNKSNISLANYL